MIHSSINLPARYRRHKAGRFNLSFIKYRQTLATNPLLLNLRKIHRVRSGNKLSRFFRYLFEHKNIRKILGANLAALAITASLIPNPSQESIDLKEIVISPALIQLTTQKGVRYPVINIKITQGYKLYHPGIDFDGLTGEAVYPIMPGKIEAIQSSNYGYGNAVLVSHGNKLTSFYAHLSKINVQAEEEVTPATEIGKIGTTGYAHGDHLHLEIRDNGYPINPLTILPLP